MARILLVEDDQFIREIYNETLTSAGFQVVETLNGEEAYLKIKSEQFDLILLDIVLPKITGLQLAKKLLAEGYNLKSSIVFTTNSDALSDLDEAMKFGAGYIIKSSVTPEELVQKIKEFLEKKATVKKTTTS